VVATKGGEVSRMWFLNRLKAFVDHPITHLLVGLALVTTGGLEIYRDVIDESQRFRIGAHHGIVILGVAQVLAALPDVVVGVERWLRAAEIALAKEREKARE
jgi:hypothetical protein